MRISVRLSTSFLVDDLNNAPANPSDIHQVIADTTDRLDSMLWLDLLEEGDVWYDDEVMEMLTYVYQWRMN